MLGNAAILTKRLKTSSDDRKRLEIATTNLVPPDQARHPAGCHLSARNSSADQMRHCGGPFTSPKGGVGDPPHGGEGSEWAGTEKPTTTAAMSRWRMSRANVTNFQLVPRAVPSPNCARLCRSLADVGAMPAI